MGNSEDDVKDGKLDTGELTVSELCLIAGVELHSCKGGLLWFELFEYISEELTTQFSFRFSSSESVRSIQTVFASSTLETLFVLVGY